MGASSTDIRSKTMGVGESNADKDRDGPRLRTNPEGRQLDEF